MKLIKHIVLEVEPVQTVEIPFNSEILGFNLLNNKPTLHVHWDDGHRPMARKFHMFPADKEIPSNFNRTNYVGSFQYFQDEKGSIALHVFEE